MNEINDQNPPGTHLLADPVLTFNVGGTLYRTHRSTITKFPNTLLARVITGDCGISLKTDSTGQYFIDRSPVEFDQLMAYYRDGTIPSSSAVCRYWGIVDDDMQDVAQSVVLLKQSVTDVLDGSLDLAKRWVRSIVGDLSSFAQEYSTNPRVTFTVIRRGWLCGLDKWLSSKERTPNELADVSSEFHLSALPDGTNPVAALVGLPPLPDGPSVYERWLKFRESVELSREDMHVIKAILTKLGFKRVEWKYKGQDCYCSRSGYKKTKIEVSSVNLYESELHQSNTPKQLVSTVSVRLCPRSVYIYGSQIPMCPGGTTPIYELSFLVLTNSEYRKRLIL
jgi:BTB/POZ domain